MSDNYIDIPPKSGGGVSSLNSLIGALTLVAGSNITITPSGLDLAIASSGGGGGSPGGSNGEVQFNDSGSFGGFGFWDSANEFLGVNQNTPAASIHAGTEVVNLPAPSGTTAVLDDFASSSGIFNIGTGSRVYYNYSYDSSLGIYSAAADIIEFDEPPSSTFDPSTISANINYSEAGYTASGTTFQYQVWAIYNGVYISLGVVQSSPVTDDSSGNPFAVDISWVAPSWITPAPSFYLLQMIQGPNNGQYQTPSSTSFTDQNTGWGSAPGGILSINYSVTLNWTPGSVGLNSLLFDTAAPQSYILNVGAPQTQTTSGWTPGAPVPTPSSFAFPSLISDGTTLLVNTGGNLGFFGSPSQPQQTGDVASAMAEYGLVTSPIYGTSFVKYPSTVALTSADDLQDAGGNKIADLNGNLYATFSLVAPNSTGIDNTGKFTANQYNFNTAGSSGLNSLYVNASDNFLHFTNSSSIDAAVLVGTVNLTTQTSGTLPSFNGGTNSNGAITNVSGSTSGTVAFSQPFRMTTNKRVMIFCNALVGTASYTFPSVFSHTPVVLTTSGLAASLVTSLSTTAATVTGTTTTGILIIDGY